MRLRRLILAVHRDAGYLFAALTIVYAISGVAVNHFEHWNPNYSISVTRHDIESLPVGGNDEIATAVLRELGIDETPKSIASIGPEMLKIFYDQRTLTVFREEGVVVDELVVERTGLYEMNFLHLNHGKGFWTWFADLYAIGLMVLAMTGIFIIPGKKGIKGRGGLLMAVGILIPLVYLFIVKF